MLSEILPKGLPFSNLNRALKKKEISKLINTSFRKCGLKDTVVFADKLLQAGFRLATRAGISICIDDMLVPKEKPGLIERAEKEVKEIEQQYVSGLVTSGERYNKVVDIWGKTGDEVGKVMMSQLSKQKTQDRHGKQVDQESFNSIYMMADSGARGSAAQIRQLAGMRGLMAKPDGSIIETPITANFREGLNVLQYFISTHGARKGLADTALKTANSGYLTRRLVDVTQDLVVIENDCQTMNGLNIRALVEGGEVIESLRDRALGRVAATDILDPETQQTIVPAGEMLDEDMLDALETAAVDEVKVRTALTCGTRFGICAKCYGRDLGRGGLVNVGEAIGVIAAQSIGEPGTQLTMRTFHIGGAASRAAVASSVDAKSDGTVGFNATMRYVTNGKGELVVISRSGEIIITDPHGRERERHKVPYGALLAIKSDQSVKAGTVLANWDPLTRPVITEFAGKARFENVEEGVTVAKQLDEVTGLSTLVVIDPKRRGATKVIRPQVKLIDASGNEVKIPGTDHSVTIAFQVGSLIQIRDGQDLSPGEVLARIPVEGQKTRDITGGLPRVAELFEARTPKDKGTLAEMTGTVSFGKETKGKVRLQITDPEGKVYEELVLKEKNIVVHEGQVVNKGRVDRRRAGRSAGHPAPAGHGRAGALHRRRGAGRLSPPGREDQRQAHRGDRSPDAAPRADLEPGRLELHPRRAGRALGAPGQERQADGRRQDAGDPRRRPARHHQGVAVDRQLHLGGVVPGNHPGAHRGGDHGQARRAARSQGKRHRRSAHPGRYRHGVPRGAQGQGSDGRRRASRHRGPGGRGARGGADAAGRCGHRCRGGCGGDDGCDRVVFSALLEGGLRAALFLSVAPAFGDDDAQADHNGRAGQTKHRPITAHEHGRASLDGEIDELLVVGVAAAKRRRARGHRLVDHHGPSIERGNDCVSRMAGARGDAAAQHTVELVTHRSGRDPAQSTGRDGVSDLGETRIVEEQPIEHDVRVENGGWQDVWIHDGAPCLRPGFWSALQRFPAPHTMEGFPGGVPSGLPSAAPSLMTHQSAPPFAPESI